MIRRLLLISRPRFWFYTLGPFLLGIVYAQVGFTRSLLGLLIPYSLVGSIYFSFFIGLWVYGINDYADQDTDSHTHKKIGKENKIADHHVQIGIFTALLASGMYYLMQPTPLTSALLIIFLLSTAAYSYPPLRFKARPFIDFISNGFYILPGLIAFTAYTNTLPPLWVILSGWFWCMGMHLYSAIPDIAADQAAQLRTSAVVLGKTKSLILTGALWLLAGLISTVASPWLFLISIIYVFVPVIILYKKLDETTVYWYFPWLNTGIGFGLFFYGLFT